ncbi:MAG TPA: hypothetical protein VNH17_13230 [Streptosporangiaceae bacterium]|nr:hypothetical protein [Streptosporangiaceae bacterium]
MARLTPEALPMLPSDALRAWLRGAWKRLRCQHVFTDDDGYATCALCGTWEMP